MHRQKETKNKSLLYQAFNSLFILIIKLNIYYDIKICIDKKKRKTNVYSTMILLVFLH